MANKTTGIIGITGARGFVGSSLIHLLQENSIPFIAYNGDINDHDALKAFFTQNRITTLIHLAGSFSPPFENLLEKNVLLTQKVLAEGLKHDLMHVIYTSSGAVYGNKEEATETDLLKPVSDYGLSKVLGEEVVKYFSKNITYTILRFPNLYGNEKGKGVISLFLNSIKEGKPIIIEGDGSQVRQFLHVQDSVKAIISVLSEKSSAIYNIAYSRKYTIAEIVAMLQKKYSFSVRKMPLSNTQTFLSMNTEKAEKELHFYPEIDLEDFLKDNI